MPRNGGDRGQPRRLLRQAKAGGGGAGGSRWLQAHPSVTLCPLTRTLMEAPLVRIAAAFHRTPPLIRDEILGQAVVL